MKLKCLLWAIAAKLLARPAVADWLIARAQLTPYLHIMSADRTEIYMGRWWLFNPYSRETNEPSIKWLPWSFRIHHIKRPDADRDLHDHPWNARTVILRGFYKEQRRHDWFDGTHTEIEYWREPGDTAELRHGEYHRIDEVSPNGVWTLFITSSWKGDWGFLVNGVKVPWRNYTGEQ